MECVLLAIASSILSGTALSAAMVVAGSKLGADVVSPNNSESSPTLVNALESSSQSKEEEKDTMKVALECTSSHDSGNSRSNISSSLALFVAFVHQWNVWQRQIMGCHRSSKTNVDNDSDKIEGIGTQEQDDDDDDKSFDSCDLSDALPPHEEEDDASFELNSILGMPPFEAFAIPSRVMASVFVIPKLQDKPTSSDFDDNDSVTLCKKNR